MLRVIFDVEPDKLNEQGAFLHWALFSIAYVLESNGEDKNEIESKTREIFQKLVNNSVGNRSDKYQLTELDFETIFEAVINWVANNKDGFVPLTESMNF